MTEREKEFAIRMANANAPKDPIEELREAIRLEKEQLDRNLNKMYRLGMLIIFVLIVTLVCVLCYYVPKLWTEPASSFHATHYERAVLADYNGKKTVYLINGNDTTRLEVK